MDIQSHSLLNSGLCWFIVLMAIIGYILTVRRLKQKWAFWVTLIIGWTFLAISNSLSALRIVEGTYYPLAVWLSSYVMVIASLVLLFIKFTQIMGTRKELRKQGIESILHINKGGSE